DVCGQGEREFRRRERWAVEIRERRREPSALEADRQGTECGGGECGAEQRPAAREGERGVHDRERIENGEDALRTARQVDEPARRQDVGDDLRVRDRREIAALPQEPP